MNEHLKTDAIRQWVNAPNLAVDEVRLRRADREEQATGLLGYISFRLNRGLRIDGISLRKTRNGRYALSFPGRRSLTGQEFPFIRPLDDSTRLAIESQVFAQLGLTDEVRT